MTTTQLIPYRLLQFPRSTLVCDISPDAIHSAADASEMTSDYSWLSLRSWNPEAEVSLLDGAIVVGFHDYHDPGQRFFGFTGGRDPSRIASMLLETAQERGWTSELRLIPEQTAKRIKGRFHLLADRANFDYLYNPRSVVDLHGPAHKLNRKQRGHFRREFKGRYQIDVHRPLDAPWAAIVAITERWASAADDQAAASDEVKSVLRCCATLELHTDNTNTWITTLRIDDEVVGYDITELLPGGWALNHFRHTPRSTIGAHVELRTAAALTLSDLGVEHWNAEQDLGVEGLRMRKMRDRPSEMLRKFVVRVHE